MKIILGPVQDREDSLHVRNFINSKIRLYHKSFVYQNSFKECYVHVDRLHLHLFRQIYLFLMRCSEFVHVLFRGKLTLCHNYIEVIDSFLVTKHFVYTFFVSLYIM